MDYTIKSIYFPQGAIRVFPDTAATSIENQIDGPVTRQDNMEKAIAIKTLSPEYHPSIFDKGPYFRDETWGQFVEWRMMGEENQTIKCVPEVKSVGIMIPTQGRYHPATITGTTIYDSLIKLNMRDVGKYISMEYNFREHLMNYMKSDEGQKLAASLNKEGYRAENIEHVAIGFIPEQAIYAIGRLPNGKVVIYSHKDAHKKIDGWAERGEGIKSEELREAAIGEELLHNFRKSYDKAGIPEEKATKSMLKGFYETLSKTTSNPKLKAKYERIIEHLENDISTVSRYARIHSNNLHDLVDLYCADVGELERVLELEALEQGINTEKGVSEYKSAKLEEIAEAAEKEYSGKEDAERDNTVGDRETSEYDGAEYAEGGDAEGEACAKAEDGGNEGGAPESDGSSGESGGE